MPHCNPRLGISLTKKMMIKTEIILYIDIVCYKTTFIFDFKEPGDVKT